MDGISWWSAKAISFKLSRKSEAASILKASISSKLPDFLSDYSDDVLAEYITVLVCNGKSQYQARDDLHAFLGERAADFVSWLWDFLLNHAHQSNADFVALSDPLDVAAHPSMTKNEGASNAGHESVQCSHKSNKKVVNHGSSWLPNEREKTPSRHLESSPSEYAHHRHISATNMTGTGLWAQPTGVVSHSHHSGRPRGSVWDRLGKPCDGTPEGIKTVDVSGVGLMKQDEQVINQQPSVLPVPTGERSRTVTGEVPGLGNNNLAESRKFDDVLGTICKHHAVSNIGRKRHFGEVDAGLGSGPVPLVVERNVGLPCKENSQDFKKSNLTKDSKTTTPNLASEVLDVKQKLHQIEMEMSTLRSRQVKIEKDGKPNLLLNSSPSKLPEEDSESRTVLVTNVHFAGANKKALSLYFAKCGAVVNVVTLTDKSTAQQRGSAYVIFARKESVDNALQLSGARFFSRPIKVVRKAELAGATLGPCQLAGSPCKAPFTHTNRNFTPNKLQWRRASTSDPSEPSVPSTVKVNVAASSATAS
ncbi:hypothetical protein FH972_017786 [Carpinus fangiana]|uniref:RRM domain-containing protein n=1 Tax=Carpinus fangiana TaxID=176857 RepID=A0A5N6RMZ1_9ROSI|nr:hypothetical protein FH972_017786 [Carpinus fangiana]